MKEKLLRNGSGIRFRPSEHRHLVSWVSWEISIPKSLCVVKARPSVVKTIRSLCSWNTWLHRNGFGRLLSIQFPNFYWDRITFRGQINQSWTGLQTSSPYRSCRSVDHGPCPWRSRRFLQPALEHASFSRTVKNFLQRRSDVRATVRMSGAEVFSEVDLQEQGWWPLLSIKWSRFACSRSMLLLFWGGFRAWGRKIVEASM